MGKKTRIFAQVLITVVLVALGAAGLVVMTMSKPPMAQKNTKPVLPRVRTVAVDLKVQPVLVHGEGEVEPLRQSTLATQVKGRVMEISPNLVDGGMVKKDEVLVKVDRRDYELNLTLAKAQVEAAQSDLTQTREDAAASLEEWKRFGRKGDPPPLVARTPQLEAAAAQLEAAKAQLNQARLELARTEITAPYDGRISAKYVDQGQYLKVGEKVADLYGTRQAEVVTQLEDAALPWLDIPGLTSQKGTGSAAVVSVSFGGHRVTWQGRVMRAQGQLDPRTRMTPVVIRVEEPFSTQPPLAPGLFVQVEITGRELPRAVWLPRSALRAGGVMWVVAEDGTMNFQPVEVARMAGDRVLVMKGLEQGQQVVVSTLQAVTQGMKVRAVPAGDEPKAVAKEEAGS